MPRWGIVVTDEMDEAVKGLADERGATISNLVRLIVKEYLAEHGQQVEGKMKWGGKRKRESQRTSREPK